MTCIYLSTEKYDIASALIRFGTRSEWSHAGFYHDGRTFSAMLDGVKWRDVNKKAKMLFLDVDGVDRALDWALTQEGKPYDRSAILGIALDRDWAEEDSWFCSELVAASFLKTGNNLFNMMAKASRITPRDLLLSLKVRLMPQWANVINKP